MTLWQRLTIPTSANRLPDIEFKPRPRKRTFRPRAVALVVTVACAAVLVLPVAARAGWPERPVKLIVTFPPGSANDAAARIFADGLSKKWGKPVVVEDKPGAEGTIGVGAFVSGQDDHTLLYTVAGSVTVAPLLIDKLAYDVDQDLQPVAATTAIVLTLAVSNDLSVRSIPELIEVLRSHPGKYAWTSGPSLPTICFCGVFEAEWLADELHQLPRCITATSRSWRRPNTGPGHVADRLFLSCSDRKGALPRRHQSHPRRRIAGTSDGARARPSGARN